MCQGIVASVKTAWQDDIVPCWSWIAPRVCFELLFIFLGHGPLDGVVQDDVPLWVNGKWEL